MSTIVATCLVDHSPKKFERESGRLSPSPPPTSLFRPLVVLEMIVVVDVWSSIV